MVKPIMLGRIVERRDRVRRGFLSPLSTAFSTFFSKYGSIKGRFLERSDGMAYPLKLFATATYDEFSTLVAAGHTCSADSERPTGYRVLAPKLRPSPPYCRLVCWVHRSTANGRTNATPACSTCFTQNARNANSFQHCQLRPGVARQSASTLRIRRTQTQGDA